MVSVVVIGHVRFVGVNNSWESYTMETC